LAIGFQSNEVEEQIDETELL